MVQVINDPTRGHILGRIGKNFGAGLAEQIPKEVERNRLASGLEALSKEEGLTPFQQLGKLATLPGVTPQLIQSGAELLKNQGVRQGYSRSGMEGGAQGPSASQLIRDVKFQGGQGGPQQERPVERGQPLGEEQVVPKGPTSPELQTRQPWTPQQRDAEIKRIWDRPENANRMFPEIEKIAADNERRYLEMPVAAQAEYQRRQGELDDAKKRFRNTLETKLQKTGEGVYKDITGENLASLERDMDRYLATHPEVSKDDAADMFSAKGLNLAKTKSQLKHLRAKMD